MLEEENKTTSGPSQGVDINSGGNVDTSTGLIAYLTLIGFAIALVLNNEKKGETKSFGAFHLRQSLGLMITALIVWIGLSILASILMMITTELLVIIIVLKTIVPFGILALVIIGVINAANGKKQELPVIGGFINKTLGRAFE